MSEKQNLGTLTWDEEAGCYWLDGCARGAFKDYPMNLTESGEFIDHSLAPESLTFGDVTFTRVNENDNIFKSNILGDNEKYWLMDIDGTGFYTGLMGRALNYYQLQIGLMHTDGSLRVKSVTADGAIVAVKCFPIESGMAALEVYYAKSADNGGGIYRADYAVDGLQGMPYFLSAGKDASSDYDTVRVWNTYGYYNSTQLGIVALISSKANSSRDDAIVIFKYTDTNPNFNFNRLGSIEELFTS